ncbi:hypothetical protein NUACC26_086190 [Scytonema sp. NUACC26]
MNDCECPICSGIMFEHVYELAGFICSYWVCDECDYDVEDEDDE